MPETPLQPCVKNTDLCSLQCFSSICFISDLFFAELKLKCLAKVFASGNDKSSKAMSNSISDAPRIEKYLI